MKGPELIARALSKVRTYGPHHRRWQYNSRSDYHSQVSCWAIMFDLLWHCALLREHVQSGKVGFGINHEMRDFQNNKPKCLDLVICRPQASASPASCKVLNRPVGSFLDFAEALELPLTDDERERLLSLPHLPIVPVGMVHAALEAKAAMTEFSKARPRLFSELDSSISVINGHAQHAIAAALVMVNVASEFLSPLLNPAHFDSPGVKVSVHRRQPEPAEGVIETVRALRRRSAPSDRGFDAIGLIVVDMRNDGSPCKLVNGPPAPDPSDTMHYSQMITRAAAIYAQRFSGI